MPGHYGKKMPKGKTMTAAMKKKMALEKLKKLKKKKYWLRNQRSRPLSHVHLMTCSNQRKRNTIDSSQYRG